MKYLSDEGYHLLTPKPLRIERLGSSEESFDDALANLLDKVITEVVKWSKKGVPVYVNATGGFKAETQFLVIAAALAGAKASYYIHETFKDVVELPLPLIKLDERLERLVSMVKSSGGVVSRSELEDMCRTLGLDISELEKDRKLIVKGTRLRKWLLRLAPK